MSRGFPGVRISLNGGAAFHGGVLGEGSEANPDRPLDYYHANPELRGVIARIRSGYFSKGDQEMFKPLVDSLLFHDTFMLFADFAACVDAQQQVDEAYRDQERWTRMSILNAARAGKFSSDRAIREYCRDIWKDNPAPVTLD